MNLIYHWYAAYTRSRGEKATAAYLESQGIEVYLPLQRKLQQWSDRKKWVEVPYINSYVFLRVSEKEYYQALNSPGIVRYVTFERKAAIIPDWQIDAMKKIVSNQIPVTFSEHRFTKGEKVHIETGALMGYNGEVVQDVDGKKKVLIRIEQIGMGMLVQIDLTSVKKIKTENN